MRYRSVLLAVAAAAFASPAAGDHAAGFQVVVHADNPVGSLEVAEVSRMFLKKTEHWDDGTAVAPVDRDAGSPVREAFSRAVHGQSATATASYWQRTAFSGRDAPPPELRSDAEVLDFVAREPGAIGYVEADAYLPPEVKALAIPDLDGDGDGATEAGSGPRLARAGADDETVSRHGDLRLFLTGACGPDGEGRQAVLENRDPDYAVGAEVEISVWEDGWLRSSSLSRYTVEPLAEERLGCTRRPGGAERRYAIVRASSATEHRVERRPDRPARSVIAIVDSGSCGQRRAGTWRSVINRHTSREVSVEVEVQELDGDAVRRRYRKRHRLAPGATQRLGCSADGPLAMRFTVIEADYR